jgi:hypothetical protein
MKAIVAKFEDFSRHFGLRAPLENPWGLLTFIARW